MFIGRSQELSELERRYESGKKEFGVLYGRRRIGKSALIARFLEGKKGLLFQAKRDNAYGNLRSFSYALSKYLSYPKSFVFSSWEEAFDALEEGIKGERFVLAIDEYPYILEQDPSFPSLLQEFIDQASDNLFLIVSGSDVSLLKSEIQNHASPLYKRRTFEMGLTQLPLSEALLFLSEVEEKEKFDYLALMSTFPYYLSAINPKLSFDENVQILLFNQYGTFFTLPDQLLSNSSRVQDVYNAILGAISHRKRTVKEISDEIHEEDAKVSKYLLTLLKSELVEKRETFMGNKRTNYYEIGDPLLRFWYSFLFENQERIKINGRLVWEEEKEKIRLVLSHGFEEVCRLYLQGLNQKGKLGRVYPKPQVYRVEKSRLGRSIELDGLALSGDHLLVMECKYRSAPFDWGMLEHLKESASVFPDKLVREYFVFSKSGFTEEVKFQAGEHLRLITLEDILHLQDL